MKLKEKKKWYHKEGGIIFWLIFFFPVGLYLMWKYSNWSNKIKAVITVSIFILGVIGMFTDNETSSQHNEADEQVVKEVEAPKTIEETITEALGNNNEVYVEGSVLYIKENRANTKRKYYHSAAKQLYNDIHNLLSDIPQEITTVCVWFETEFIDNLGNEYTDTAYRINIPLETLKSINWDNYIALDFESLSNGDMYAWHGLK